MKCARRMKSKAVKSPDDFYPSYSDGTVIVTVCRIMGTKGDKGWRVSVWGDDDFGLEKDNLTITDAFTLYRSISNGITIAALKQLDFIGA